MKNIINISGYLFTTLYDTIVLKQRFKNRCNALQLKGAVVLSPEGINVMFAGTRDQIDNFYDFLKEDVRFAGMQFKESLTETRPFWYCRIKRKGHLVPTDNASINPMEFTAPTITPKELKKWYEENKDFTIIDTRNDYEYEMGTFENAINPDLKEFRQFDDYAQSVDDETKEKPVVVFCTGGIRCEKASPIALQAGFKEVYQLDGGILNYFKEIGGEHYQGDCFVFDQRVAVRPDLSSVQE